MMRRLAVALLLCSLLGCPAEPPGPPDFELLSAAAFPKDGTKPPEPGLKLWTALFKLPTWYFLSTGDPSTPAVEGNTLMVFTDMTRLQNYAEHRARPLLYADGGLAPPQVADAGITMVRPYVDAQGKAYFVAMNVEQAVSYLQHPQGAPVAGVRFNAGSTEWWGQIDGIMKIRGILQRNGRL